MKRKIYISAFILLGILLQFLLHASLEIWYIGLLLWDFEKYGFGLNWGTWLMTHHIGAVVLFIAGILLGFLQGKYWWKKIYESR